MSQYESTFAIRALAINQNGFTDLAGLAVLPIDCNYIEIFNDSGQDISFRSDPNNAASEIIIHDAQMFPIGAPLAAPGSRTRFPAGSTLPVGALKAAVSPVNVYVLSLF